MDPIVSTEKCRGNHQHLAITKVSRVLHVAHAAEAQSGEMVFFYLKQFLHPQDELTPLGERFMASLLFINGRGFGI